jgi:hypothetical protein
MHASEGQTDATQLLFCSVVMYRPTTHCQLVCFFSSLNASSSSLWGKKALGWIWLRWGAESMLFVIEEYSDDLEPLDPSGTYCSRQ